MANHALFQVMLVIFFMYVAKISSFLLEHNGVIIDSIQTPSFEIACIFDYIVIISTKPLQTYMSYISLSY